MLHPSRVGCRVLKLSSLTRLGEHCRYHATITWGCKFNMIPLLIFLIVVLALFYGLYTSIKFSLDSFAASKRAKRKLHVAKRAHELAKLQLEKSPNSPKALKAERELASRYASLVLELKSDTKISNNPLSAFSVIGGIVLVLGLGLAVYSFAMDTSVTADGVGRVVNLDLQQKQMMTLIAGVALSVIGLIVLLYGANQQGMATAGSKQLPPNA